MEARFRREARADRQETDTVPDKRGVSSHGLTGSRHANDQVRLAGKAIEGLGVNLAPSGFALGEQRRGLTVPGGRETRHRMERQRLIRQAGPAAQLPIAQLE